MMRAEDLDAAVNADGDFDFGLIRPMPKSLMIAEGSRPDLAIAAAMDKRSGDAEAFEAAVRAAGLPWAACPASILRGHGCAGPDGLVDLAEAYLRNIEAHGFRSWYGWCREHWGTKWNARVTAIEDCGGYRVAEFYTAGARPSLEMLGELAAGNGPDFSTAR